MLDFPLSAHTDGDGYGTLWSETWEIWICKMIRTGLSQLYVTRPQNCSQLFLFQKICFFLLFFFSFKPVFHTTRLFHCHSDRCPLEPGPPPWRGRSRPRRPGCGTGCPRPWRPGTGRRPRRRSEGPSDPKDPRQERDQSPGVLCSRKIFEGIRGGLRGLGKFQGMGRRNPSQGLGSGVRSVIIKHQQIGRTWACEGPGRPKSTRFGIRRYPSNKQIKPKPSVNAGVCPTRPKFARFGLNYSLNTYYYYVLINSIGSGWLPNNKSSENSSGHRSLMGGGANHSEETHGATLHPRVGEGWWESDFHEPQLRLQQKHYLATKAEPRAGGCYADRIGSGKNVWKKTVRIKLMIKKKIF